MSKSARSAQGADVKSVGVDHSIQSSFAATSDAVTPLYSSSALPRPTRRPRRNRVDRGLPADEEVVRLAEVYLERQRKLWPELFPAGLLSEPTPEVIQAMVSDFKLRHRGGAIDVEAIRPFVKICAKLGGAYHRYSCENSNPTSIAEQLVNCLELAKEHGCFVPWKYVFADFSVTALDSSRQGYTSYKLVLGDKSQLVETTFIDDFTRASRDELEWWKLAALVKRLNKRMIGASDGFDNLSPNWDLWITIYGLLSRLFIKSIREKVGRGMRGAARRGTCLGKLPLGFTKRPKIDGNGNVVVGADGLPVFEPCIDPTTSEHRLLMFHMFVELNLSVSDITKQFNQMKVDGWDGWTVTAIRKLLWSATAIGVFI